MHRTPSRFSLAGTLWIVLVGLPGTPFWIGHATEAPATLEDLRRISVADTMVMVPMRDGVRLATDIFRPRGTQEDLPLVFIRTPYDFNEIEGTVLQWTYQAVRRGYAVAIQNERGRYYSEGEWEILGEPRTDGPDALSWFAAQKWSNGAVGTLGCSSSAEWQLALATQSHPAHKAMVPMAAGAGIGRVGEFHEQGNWYKGGVHQTLFSVWLYSVQQGLRPRFPAGLPREDLQRARRLYDLAPEMPDVDWKKQLLKLPAIDWIEDAGGNTGPMSGLMARTPASPGWYEGGLYHDDEPFGVPAFWFNSWFDVSQGPNLALFNHVREFGTTAEVRDGQFLLIAPTLHCGFYRIPATKDLVVGELNVGNPSFPLYDMVFRFLDHYLKGEGNDLHDEIPRVQYYTMGQNRWNHSDHWPPREATPVTLYLGSEKGANSVFGDGFLRESPGEEAGADQFTYDPMNPVPARGGGVCCNQGVAPGGSYDQRDIETRADVLVYSSAVLEHEVVVTGSIRATLFVSSDARDTDFTVKLVDVLPDGTAYNVDDTILRARYRDGYEQPVFMEPGEIYELNPTPMSTSYAFGKGHRVRVEVSSSKFPQYMRNLNTGGNNYDETESVVAHNVVHHSGRYASRIVLPVMP